jgi:hypothetical protein
MVIILVGLILAQGRGVVPRNVGISETVHDEERYGVSVEKSISKQVTYREREVYGERLYGGVLG